MTAPFGLFLFATDPNLVRRAAAAGVSAFVVDWENRGKPKRQHGADTQINYDTAEDLERVRAATRARIVCRINRVGEWTAGEVETAIRCGADEILVPMVTGVGCVARVLDLCRDRVRVGILVETAAAVGCAAELGRLPISRAYAGLNDLMIDRGSDHLFRAVEDGTVERIRDAFQVPFGFGGLTLPGRGRPVPCRLLVGEMVRLGCEFTFLRRSFLADSAAAGVAPAIDEISRAIRDARVRSPKSMRQDREDLETVLSALPPCREWPTCASS